MDPEAFTTNLFKWDPRGVVSATYTNRPALLEVAVPVPVPESAPYQVRGTGELGGLEDLFQAYGIRYYTAAKIAELGFTASTLVDMKDKELEEMMNSVSQIFRWDLLVGERYGIIAAVRAERRRIEEEDLRRRNLLSADTTCTTNFLDTLSQEGLSEEHVLQQEKEAVGSGGGRTWEVAVSERRKLKQQRKPMSKTKSNRHHHQRHGHLRDENEDDQINLEENEENDEGNGGGYGASCERQREHPFIVTEPGEVARGKKNGLDYLFHLYEQCREFLVQVQNMAKDRGEKCPTKVSVGQS